MQWSVNLLCGTIGWLVVIQSSWLNPFVIGGDFKDKTCMISFKDFNEIQFAVLADDGNIYDAVALRTWLRQCRKELKPMCVIPGRPIGIVKPVRNKCPLLNFQKYNSMPVRSRSVAVQTDARESTVCQEKTQFQKVVKKRVTSVIPSKHSAFIKYGELRTRIR